MTDIRPLQEADITTVAAIHRQQFTRQSNSEKWISCYLKVFPKSLCYVAEENSTIVGYIVWTQKSGFRPEAVLELEQIAIYDSFQNQGIGSTLITSSLELVKSELAETGSTVKSILVSTRTDNHAQEIYKKTLNAKPEAVISNLFSADEVFMVARLSD